MFNEIHTKIYNLDFTCIYVDIENYDPKALKIGNMIIKDHS